MFEGKKEEKEKDEDEDKFHIFAMTPLIGNFIFKILTNLKHEKRNKIVDLALKNFENLCN